MKVAIVGTVPHTRALAPYDDESWEIWVCSPGNAYGEVKRASRWFELHGIIDLKGPENASWNSKYFGWLQQQKFPVYMQEENDLLPQCTVFPGRKLFDEFAPFSRLLFTSSISWMAAYALHLGATEIAIFGVDMAAMEEQYSGQKSGLQLLSVLAEKEYGVSIQTPMEASLMVPPALYGYAEASQMGRFLYVHEIMMNEKFAKAAQTLEAAALDKQFISGQLEALRFFRRTFVNGEDALMEMDEPEKVVVHRPHMGTFEMSEGGVLVKKMNGTGEHATGD